MNCIEPCAVQEVFASHLVRIESFGQISRLIFATPQGSTFDDNTELVIVARLLVPTENLTDIIAGLRGGEVRSLEKSEPPLTAKARSMN